MGSAFALKRYGETTFAWLVGAPTFAKATVGSLRLHS
jgi:hypothetical protein